MIRLLCFTFLLVLIYQPLEAQTTLYYQDFEGTDFDTYTLYDGATNAQPFMQSGGNYILRDVESTFPFGNTVTGMSGKFIGCENTDDAGYFGLPFLRTNSFSIAGYTNLTLSINFSAPRGNSIFIYETSDFVDIDYRIDGGAWQQAHYFQGASNWKFYYDAAANGVNGSGDDVLCDQTAQVFLRNLTGTGNNMEVRITMACLGSNEEYAFDDILVQGSAPCTPTAGTDVITACDSYTWIDGNTYTSNNNTALDTLVNAGGCDSIVTLDLTILNSTAHTDVIVACDSFQWMDGNTYSTNNNSATHIIPNAAGCDSVITLDLTITNSTSYTDVQSACDTFQWIDGNTYTANNNTATVLLTNAVGCDSLVTLNLTIHSSTAGTDVITACRSYQWIDGNTYFMDNNTATHTLAGQNGCDSVVTLDLTITNVNTTVNASGAVLTAVTSGASYQWLDCDNGYSVIAGETNQSFTATVNGNYAVEITENNCVDTSACYPVTGIGIDDKSLTPFTLSPNPTTGLVNVELGGEQSGEIELANTLGQVVYRMSFYNETRLQLDLSDVEKGTYWLVLTNENRRGVVTVVLN